VQSIANLRITYIRAITPGKSDEFRQRIPRPEIVCADEAGLPGLRRAGPRTPGGAQEREPSAGLACAWGRPGQLWGGRRELRVVPGHLAQANRAGPLYKGPVVQ